MVPSVGVAGERGERIAHVERVGRGRVEGHADRPWARMRLVHEGLQSGDVLPLLAAPGVVVFEGRR